MREQPVMPSPLEITKAMAELVSAKLADQSAERIYLSRDETAVCLGIIEGVAERLELDSRRGA